MLRRTYLVLLFTALLASLFMAGCGDDDDPVTVPTDCTETDPQGTISVNTEPDVIHAAWQLTGPNGYVAAGVGDILLENLFAGNYAVQWNVMEDYDQPNPSTITQYLSANQDLTFDGHYTYSGPARWEPVLIPPTSVSMPATFTMGSLVESNETPHQVTLTRRFNMASTEVTKGQFIMALQWAYDHNLVTITGQDIFDVLDGSDVRLFRYSLSSDQITFVDDVFTTDKPNEPLLGMYWYGAAAYCDWLSLQNDLPRAYDHSTWECNGGDPYAATGFRLPTEAEWEFACRAGTTGPFNSGDCLMSGQDANYIGSHPYVGCPAGPIYSGVVGVGSFFPNSWGLYDMHGNVNEWCHDYFGAYGADETDPQGAAPGSDRVVKGGSYDDVASDCRSAWRDGNTMSYGSYYNSFRPVVSAP